MVSPNRSNGLSTAVNQGSIENPADAVPPPEDDEENEAATLYEERIDRYVADDEPSAPLSDSGTVTPEERAQARLNEFEAAFTEGTEEPKEEIEKAEEEAEDEEEHAEEKVDDGDEEQVEES